MDELTPHLERFHSYESAREQLRIRIPDRINIAEAICRRHDDRVTRTAIVESRVGGNNSYTFGAIDYLSDKFANRLARAGLEEGDSVAVILPQSAALAIAQFGALKLGAVIVPLPTGAGEQLIEHALTDSGAKSVVIDEASFVHLAKAVSSRIGHQKIFLDADCREVKEGVIDFWREVYSSSPDFTAVETEANAPAFIFYNSDSSSSPTRIVHGHRAAIGELATFEMLSNLSMRERAQHWLMTDWANPDSLLRMLYPAWWYGRCVIANCNEALGANEALQLIEATRATDLFLPEKKLDALIKASEESGVDLKLERIVIESRALNEKRFAEVRERFNAEVNGLCATPEASIAVMQSGDWFAPRFGSLGRPSPERLIEIIDDGGDVLPAGEQGNIAIHRTDAALFVERKNSGEEADARLAGDWFKTGITGYKDEDGFLWLLPSSD